MHDSLSFAFSSFDLRKKKRENDQKTEFSRYLPKVDEEGGY